MEYILIPAHPHKVSYVRLNGDAHDIHVVAINQFQAAVTARKLLMHRYGRAPRELDVIGPTDVDKSKQFGMRVTFDEKSVTLSEYV